MVLSRLSLAPVCISRPCSSRILAPYVQNRRCLTSGTAFSRLMTDFGHEPLVDVTPLANRMRQEVRSYTHSIPNKIRMVGILAESGPFRTDAEIYAARISESCRDDGIDFVLRRCLGDELADVEAVIREMNDRTDVHGILVFYPIFRRRGIHKKGSYYLNESTGVYYTTFDEYLRDVVCPSKDVEGLCHGLNARYLFQARGMNRTNGEVYVPCTALSVMKILEEYHQFSTTVDSPNRWGGVIVTVVNRSEILGRPLAALLALEGANVYSVDDHSILLFNRSGTMSCTDLNLYECLQQSSVVITGVPSPDFVLPSDAISPGTTVVNVSEFPNVDEEALLDIPGVQLIPHVGKVTCAALEQNLVKLYKTFSQKGSRDPIEVN